MRCSNYSAIATPDIQAEHCALLVAIRCSHVMRLILLLLKPIGTSVVLCPGREDYCKAAMTIDAAAAINHFHKFSQPSSERGWQEVPGMNTGPSVACSWPLEMTRMAAAGS